MTWQALGEVFIFWGNGWVLWKQLLASVSDRNQKWEMRTRSKNPVSNCFQWKRIIWFWWCLQLLYFAKGHRIDSLLFLGYRLFVAQKISYLLLVMAVIPVTFVENVFHLLLLVQEAIKNTEPYFYNSVLISRRTASFY